jgi:hypothetical protein
MKKKIVGLLIAFIHNQSLAATVVKSAAASGGVSIFTAIIGLSPEIWACATFGAAYAYMVRKDVPRNRLANMILSIFIAVFGSDVSASYISNSHDVNSVFLTPLLALVIAAAFPWVFEKYIVKRK